MQSQARSLTSLFRTISFVAIATLVTMLPTVPAGAQNSVPPTAVQAAKMPQFASKLGRPVKRPSSPTSPALARARMHRGPLDSNDIYDNGPTNGNTDAWTINFGYITSDSFNVANYNTNVTGMSFAAWMAPGDTVTSAEVSITSSENGGTSYFDQIVNFTQSNCVGNDYGYNVCTETASFTGPTLNAGTYWVNLQNASVPNGDPVYWDENSGTGCTSPGCPSLASENTVGTIPSESFTILGSATTTTTSTTNDENPCPDPQLRNGLQEIQELDPGTVGWMAGLTINGAGSFYGTLGGGGTYGAGMIYELGRKAGNWFFSSLYSFLGGSNGSSPSGFIVGPEGVLYGAASGGIQNCPAYGGTYCGVIYEARPSMTPCVTASCTWDETTIYEFTGFSDAWDGTVSAVDSAGNLYGISFWGGAYGYGTLFELSPTQGGWTETILHNFTGGSDGAHPTSLLMGQDGNLYGTAGVVFQFVPSGGGWTENVIEAFTGGAFQVWGAGSLIQNGPGSFYGSAFCHSWGYGGCNDEGNEENGLIFSLSRSGVDWGFDVLHVYGNGECPISNWGAYQTLAIGTAGELYATESAGLQYFCSGILDVQHEWVIVSGPPSMFSNLISDASGNLYGTSPVCSFTGGSARTYGAYGMVWQLSPHW